ncbi:MAG TPA: metallothionein [Verrucomicrobiae bacterium]|nr:metallothionein [Verrucomicrobiae bacterium]
MGRKTVAKSGSAAATGSASRRVKCACASCHCTVALDRGVRRGNLVFCGEACASRVCTLEVCRCEHDGCAA